MSTEAAQSVKVSTTLPKQPLSPNSQRAAIKTARLVVRPFTHDDIQGVHALRTQPEVMIFTAVGRIDKDLAETQAKLDLFLAPNDTRTFNFAICLADTGELIGMGGVHKMISQLGWSELGYMLKREYWGRGYTTEFMTGIVEAWWKLEREDVEVEVDVLSVNTDRNAKNVQRVPELLVATVDANNSGSLRVMQKTGFKSFKTWKEPDSRVGFEGTDVTLVSFTLGNQNLSNHGDASI